MGASGDMLTAALLELLPAPSARDNFLKKINNLGLKGVNVRAEPSIKCGIKGTHVSVTIDGKEELSVDTVDTKIEDHHHDHHHHDHKHLHTGLKDIEAILSGVPVSDNVKKHTLAVYNLLAEAESHVHGLPVSEVHFHEVGNLDAITDIIAVCMLMEELSPQKVLVSPIHTGKGFVRCSHGILPVPAPATAHILKDIPAFGGNIQGELCTPTGAALLKYFAEDFVHMPQMCVQQIGYGMGKKDFEASNCVRVFLGESFMSESSQGESSKKEEGPNNEVAELCCNLDDMTAEAIGFACQTLMDSGALDVFTTAVGMKKERPGILLTCICDTEKADVFAGLILKHTTTFGIRKSIQSRYILERDTKTIETPFGKVRLKIGKGYGIIKSKLEYDDVAALAKKHNLSINEMERKIWRHLSDQEK